MTTTKYEPSVQQRPYDGAAAAPPSAGTVYYHSTESDQVPWWSCGTPSPAQFAAAAVSAGILDLDQEGALLRVAHTNPCASSAARECVRSGLLTPYQVGLLLSGRYQELKVGPYVVLDRLGSGGMGTVLKVLNPALQRAEAVKVLSAARPDTAAAVRRFRREIRLVAPLEHPGIVRAYNAGVHRDTPYLAMELVAGQTLAQRVADRGPLSVSDAVEYLRQVGGALRYAWEGYRLVHRDIKPSNLMVTGEGRIKLLDFGIGRLTAGWGDERTLTEAGDLLGSLDYIAPEQINDARAVDHRADIYSLGCIGYYLLSGQAPYHDVPSKHKLLSHQSAEAGSLRALRPAVPAPLADLVAWMMAKSPSARVQSYEELDRLLVACTREY